MENDLVKRFFSHYLCHIENLGVGEQFTLQAMWRLSFLLSLLDFAALWYDFIAVQALQAL